MARSRRSPNPLFSTTKLTGPPPPLMNVFRRSLRQEPACAELRPLPPRPRPSGCSRIRIPTTGSMVTGVPVRSLRLSRHLCRDAGLDGHGHSPRVPRAPRRGSSCWLQSSWLPSPHRMCRSARAGGGEFVRASAGTPGAALEPAGLAVLQVRHFDRIERAVVGDGLHGASLRWGWRSRYELRRSFLQAMAKSILGPAASWFAPWSNG